MSADIDVDQLFETHSVDEVKHELQKIKNNIERKKEDLRIMVGERYRDLIEAADAIKLMEQSAAGISEKVTIVQQLCSSLQHRGLLGFKTSPQHQLRTPSKELEIMSLAAQTKLLVVARGNAWSALEHQRLLDAAIMFLLAQHTYTVLMLSHQPSHELQIPWRIIKNQWSSVAGMHQTIVHCCRHTIAVSWSAKKANHNHVREAVASLVLLQGNSLSVTLHDVLELLHESLLQPLRRCAPHKTAGTLTTTFVEQLTSALNLLSGVFAPANGTVGLSSTELLLARVATATTVNSSLVPAADDIVHPIALLKLPGEIVKLLPEAIITYQPRVLGDAEDGVSAWLREGELQSAVQTWLVSVIDNARLHVTRLFEQCPSLESLLGVRRSVGKALHMTHQIKEVFPLLGLSPDWCVWQQLLRDCLHRRACVLVTLQLSQSTTNTLQEITRIATALFEDDSVAQEEGGGALQFMWSESAEDFPLQVGWLSASQRTLQQSGGLVYKSRGYTPRTQKVCSSFDRQLEDLRRDLQHLSPEGDDAVEGSAEDYKKLLDLLQFESHTCFLRLAEAIEKLGREYSHLRSSVNNSSDETAVNEENADDDGLSDDSQWNPPLTSAHVSQGTPTLSAHQVVLVWLARVSAALADICPNMQLCSIAAALSNPDTERRVLLGLPVDMNAGRKGVTFHVGEQENSPPDQWSVVQDALRRTCDSFLQKYLDTLIDFLQFSINKNLKDRLEQDLVATMLTFMALCEDVSVGVEEESGAGEPGSHVRVPCQISPPLSAALHSTCRKLSVAVPHALSRTFCSSVPSAVCRGVAETYALLLPYAQSNQLLALHLLFDLKFVGTVALPGSDIGQVVSDDSLKAEFTHLQQKLESYVDPIDLSVVQPHINSRVRSAASRCQVTLGSLYVRDRQHPATSNGSSAPATTVLPLVPAVSIARFGNVPLPKTVSETLSSSSLLSMTSALSSTSLVQSGFATPPVQPTPRPEKSTTDERSTNLPTSFSTNSFVSAGLPSTRSATALFSAMSSSWFGGSSTK